MRLAILAAVALAGCAANSGVVAIGPETFMVSRQAATGIGGLGNLKAEAIQEAGAACVAKGKTLHILTATENEGPFVMGKYPRAEVTFMCLDAGDTRLRPSS